MIGNDTILGQIATFAENLHLSYNEIVNEIPYRLLCLMAKDKVRVCYGEKVKRTSGKEMMNRRRKNRKEK